MTQLYRIFQACFGLAFIILYAVTFCGRDARCASAMMVAIGHALGTALVIGLVLWHRRGRQGKFLMATSYSRYPWLCPAKEIEIAEPDDVDKILENAKDILARAKRGNVMHYRNGREAHNGDKVVMLNDDGEVQAFGVLHSAKPGNDYCNGTIAVIQNPQACACMVDCLHVDDVATVLAEKGLAKRPSGM